MAASLLYEMVMKDVLVVDDEKTFLDTLTEGLKLYSRYFNVITAESGKTAIEILKTFIIDVVVTDLKMPDTDGYDLVEYIKKYHPTIPIIIMTAHGDLIIEKRLRDIGIAQYIEKPLELGEIVSEILSVGKEHSSQ